MNWHEVRLEEIFPSPWRNGGGTTRELLAWPHKENWQVRVSVAEVAQSGPFSPYPGVTRWFCVLSGEGVKLRVDEQEHRLDAASNPLRFDGDSPVQCELTGGATEDFNLMLRGIDARVLRVKGRSEMACAKGSVVGIYSHEHVITFLAVQVRVTLAPRTLAWCVMPMDERIDFETEGAIYFEAAA